MRLYKTSRKYTKVIIILLCLIIFFITFRIAYAEEPAGGNIFEDIKTFFVDTFGGIGNTIKSLFIDIGDYINKLRLMFVEIIMKVSLCAFSPTYNTIIAVDQGKDAYLYATTNMFSGVQAGDTTFVSQFHGIALAGGFFLTTVLSMGSLFFCLVGRSQQIKNSVGNIVVMTLVSTFVMYTSGNIASFAISLVNDIWQTFVISDITGGNSILTSVGVDEANATVFDILTIAKDTTSTSTISVVGLGNFVVPNSFNMVFSILAFFFTWKLLKGFFSIFMEIVERYMVLMILVLFLPTATPTIISTGTSNIFKAYIRMFFSESFLFIINGIFIKVFLYYLVRGGWTAGIMNYLAALAFLKVCSKFDGWLKALGLNVAQTGGGLFNAVGGSLSRGLMMLSSLANNASRVGQSVGGAMMTKGLATGDYDTFHRGEMLKGGLVNALMGNKGSSVSSFNALLNQNAQRELQVGKGFDEPVRVTDCSKGGAFGSWATNSGLSADTLSAMSSAGIDASSCASIKEYRNAGVASFHDKMGNLLGYVNDGKFVPTQRTDLTGERKHNRTLASHNEARRNAAQASETPYLSNNMVKKHTGLTSILGTHGSLVSGTDPLKRSHSDGSQVGRQVITGTKNVMQPDNTMKKEPHTYEIYKGSLRPDIVAEAKSNRSFQHIEHEGENYYMREIKSIRISDDEPTLVSEREMSMLDMEGSQGTEPISVELEQQVIDAGNATASSHYDSSEEIAYVYDPENAEPENVPYDYVP